MIKRFAGLDEDMWDTEHGKYVLYKDHCAEMENLQANHLEELERVRESAYFEGQCDDRRHGRVLADCNNNKL